jgi:hypothetical protein
LEISDDDCIVKRGNYQEKIAGGLQVAGKRVVLPGEKK